MTNKKKSELCDKLYDIVKGKEYDVSNGVVFHSLF